MSENGTPRDALTKACDAVAAEILKVKPTVVVDGVEHRVLTDVEHYAAELVSVFVQLREAHAELARLNTRVAELEGARCSDRLAELRKDHGLPASFTWRTVDGKVLLRET